MERLAKIPTFSGSVLKIIAIVSMVIDHCAYFLMDNNSTLYEAMRCVGRIAFPVFAFLIAEGFAYTHNRKRYFTRLLVFAVISEVSWYLLNGADGTHNVMFTLALGVVALAVLEKLKENSVLCGIAILSIAYLATWSGVDYEWRGILMILVFNLLRNQNDNLPFPYGRMMQLLCAFPLMMHYGSIGALLACMTKFLYDGARGFIKGNVAKYGFYAFYPVHLLLIWCVITFLAH
ncbi:TraX family protein [Bacteroides acidifaciens]|uniref:TraX family protein n=1 Tax=Bacteroides acidifaciens TaxID=85831 RepID=UPI0025A5962F|nr:TraX family protein [Bacteroides acidifaciens]